MIEQALEKIREDLGIDYAEHHFDDDPELPYITYERPESNNFYADGVVWFSSGKVDILLHTGKRQRILERKIENILKSFSLPWEKSAEWDDEEELFIITYSTEEGKPVEDT